MQAIVCALVNVIFFLLVVKISATIFVDGTTDKTCCKILATFFCCVWMKNAARGPEA